MECPTWQHRFQHLTQGWHQGPILQTISTVTQIYGKFSSLSYIWECGDYWRGVFLHHFCCLQNSVCHTCLLMNVCKCVCVRWEWGWWWLFFTPNTTVIIIYDIMWHLDMCLGTNKRFLHSAQWIFIFPNFYSNYLEQMPLCVHWGHTYEVILRIQSLSYILTYRCCFACSFKKSMRELCVVCRTHITYAIWVWNHTNTYMCERYYTEFIKHRNIDLKNVNG